MKSFLFYLFILILVALIVIPIVFSIKEYNTPEARTERERRIQAEQARHAEMLRDGKVHIMTDTNGKKYAVKFDNSSCGQCKIEACYSVIRVAEEPKELEKPR